MAGKNHSLLTPSEKKDANKRSIKSRKKRLASSERAREDHRAHSTKFYADNPKTALIYRARQRAKKKNIICTITENDFEIPAVCPVLGIPLVRGKGEIGSASPSLDRLIPSVGYVPGNVVVMSARANRLKCDCTNAAELRAVADWIDNNIF
jgi:hypothetical protein